MLSRDNRRMTEQLLNHSNIGTISSMWLAARCRKECGLTRCTPATLYRLQMVREIVR
jgi:hypothetical protein